jgi:hypothetical protein
MRFDIPTVVICDEFCFQVYNVMQSVEFQSFFRGNVSPLSSGRKNRPDKACVFVLFRASFMVGIFYRSKYGADIFSEMSVDFHQNAWRYIPEDSVLCVRIIVLCCYYCIVLLLYVVWLLLYFLLYCVYVFLYGVRIIVFLCFIVVLLLLYSVTSSSLYESRTTATGCKPNCCK